MVATRDMAPAAAHAFAPGEYLRDELHERGWTADEFAEVIGQPIQAVSEVLNTKKEITTEMAGAVATALGTTPEVWLNLQTRYRLYRQRRAAGPQAVSISLPRGSLSAKPE